MAEHSPRVVLSLVLTLCALPPPAVITACLVFAFPAAIALFPQKASLPASALEPEFQNKVDKVGAPITTYYWNKGI